MRRKMYQLLDVIVTWTVYALMMIPLHEAFHYWIANLLGYSAVAHFPSPFMAYIEITPNPTSALDICLIGLAGGLGVALVYILVSRFTEDIETDIAVGYFASGSLIYASMEALYLFGYLPPMVLGWLPWLLAMIPMWYMVNQRLKRQKVEV